MSEQNFSFEIEDYQERGYLYNLLINLNKMGRNNLLVKNIKTRTNTPTTYEIMDYILGERTAEQYCLHYPKGHNAPTSLSDFTGTYKINTDTSDRISNIISVPAMADGGHIYYLTQADVIFFCNGFQGGFSEDKEIQISGVDNKYKLYKSNQNISRAVKIETEKAEKEEN